MKTFVSVILPVYNQEKYIAETIESVLSQTFNDFELLILDDGSTDNTVSVIQAYAKKDKRIKAFFHSNVGRPEATNFLMSKAQYELCALFDADDLMLPNRLERQVGFHLANPKVAASSCHCYYIDDKGNNIGIQTYEGLETPEQCKRAVIDGKIILCAITALMIKKSAFINTGGFKSEFWPSDDLEFLNRLIDKDYILIIIQEVLAKYRVHANAITTKKQFYAYDSLAYTNECIVLRRAGKPQITFAEFEEKRSLDKWNIKLKRLMHNYALSYHKKAGFSLYKKNYLKFTFFILVALSLDGSYVISSARKRLRLKKLIDMM